MTLASPAIPTPTCRLHCEQRSDLRWQRSTSAGTWDHRARPLIQIIRKLLAPQSHQPTALDLPNVPIPSHSSEVPFQRDLAPFRHIFQSPILVTPTVASTANRNSTTPVPPRPTMTPPSTPAIAVSLSGRCSPKCCLPQDRGQGGHAPSSKAPRKSNSIPKAMH